MPRAENVKYSHLTDASSVSCTHALSQFTSLDLAQSVQHSEAFLLAGVAAFLARFLHKETIYLETSSGLRAFVVDLEAPFSRLLVPSVNRREFSQTTIADASFQLLAGGGIDKGFQDSTVPAFRAYQEAGSKGSGSWSISLESSDWPEKRVEQALLYLANLLESADRDTGQAVGTLPLLSEREALLLYRELNATASDYPHVRVEDLVAEQARIDPSANAVVFENTTLSYARLEEESDILAAVLASAGADQQNPVAVVVPRSEWVPIIFLAALKAGSFFVPLDPAHPTQRLVDMIEECRPATVVVTAATASLFKERGLPLLVLGEDLKPLAHSVSGNAEKTTDDTAYMIYTSGTTGKPKGVMVSQRALANFLCSARRKPGLKPGDRVLAIATLSFDISMMDMFLPLIAGATLVIASEQDPRDPARLAQLLEQERITYMVTTATTWRMLVSNGWRGKSGLRILTGGEALPRNLANALIAMNGKRMELWNCYGPTETTVFSSCLRVRPGDGPVPIGGPIANTSFYIVDAKGRLLPPEIPGELYIGGDSVATGYFERPELNARKFISNPWPGQPHQRLFCTGDEACFRSDGTLNFFGRLDQQVKLRGYRIELGEIEAVLRASPAAADAAVVLREDEPGEPWLVAFVTRSPGTTPRNGLDPATLRAHSAKFLPAYMLPARYVELPELPISATGKIDKRALQSMPLPQTPKQFVVLAKPADETEAVLLKVFREVLRSPSFGLDDNFFDHGGYSLLVVRLFARIANALGTELPITALFDAPTVRQLATLYRNGNQLTTSVAIRAQGDKPPFFLVQSYLLYAMAATMVPETHPVFGLRETVSFEATGIPFEQRVNTFVDAIHRVHPEGPVHLGGWCAAATLTIEIARRLQEQGRTLGLVALFDAEVPGFVASVETRRSRMTALRATMKFHWDNLRRRGWKARFRYLFERVAQLFLRQLEWVYMTRRGMIAQLQRAMPFLPNVLFYNRWTQLSVEQLPQVRSIDAHIVLFRASEMMQLPGSDATLGWSAIARRGVDVVFVPGDHESMFKEPHLAQLGQKFSEALHQSEAELSSSTRR